MKNGSQENRYPQGKVPKTKFDVENVDKNGVITVKSKYRANQSRKHECDINRIMDKAKRTGVLSHVNKNAELYADMTDFDYEDALNQIAATNSAFYDLDAETRREFGNDPGKFRSWIANKTTEEIIEKMPQLAEPGDDLIKLDGEPEPTPPATATPTEDTGEQKPTEEPPK